MIGMIVCLNGLAAHLDAESTAGRFTSTSYMVRILAGKAATALVYGGCEHHYDLEA